MRAAFKSGLVVSLRRDGRWLLTAALTYRSKTGDYHIVPAGFDTDFASVPRLPIVYLLTGGTATEAATLHDFLYRTQTVSRLRADNLFCEASGCGFPREPAWRRALLWIGVRVGGWFAWRSNRRAGLWKAQGCRDAD